MSVLSSFIRTMTVGSGISPDLLTPPRQTGVGRSRAPRVRSGYRRWGISPRPENKRRQPKEKRWQIPAKNRLKLKNLCQSDSMFSPSPIALLLWL